VFHPEGRFVFFSNRNARFRYDRNVHQGIYEIHRYDRQTGEFSRVAANFGGAGRPAVSPDGNWLSFITRDNTETHLVLQDLRSGAQRVLWTGLDRDMQETFAWAGVYPSMDWTPDGEAIVCYARGKLWSVDVKSGDASEIALSASVELTAEEAVRSKPDVLSDTFQAKILRWVQQNPESGELVFSALGRLYRADADGANPSILLKDDDDSHLEYSPNFSRDGKKIAYVSWNDNEKGQLWISNANGGGAKQLTEMPGQYANPAFSRDGKKIVYLKGSGATLRGDDIAAEMWLSIYTIDTKGGEPTFVTTVGNRGAQARMSSPTFNSSGDRIYYMQAGGGNNAVQYVSVRLDGTDERTHATVDYGEEITMSPDGRWIAYKQHHDAYVAPIGIAGVNELALGTSDGAVKVKQLSDGLADWIHWTDDNTVTWAVGPTLAVQTMDKAWAEVAETEKGEDDETEDDDEEEVDPNAAVNIDINLEITRHRPEGVLALTNLRLITMKGDQVIDDGVVVIRGNRIAAVGRVGGEVEIPEGAKIVDARGMTAIPGLVDAHAHMGYNGLDINPQKDWQYYANLAYGVTTTMDPSASTQLVFTQAEMVEAGVMKGPRIYSTGFILYGADIPGNAPTNSLDDARKHMKRQKTLGAFAVKSYMQPRREQRQWYIKAAREENMLVFPEGGGNFEGNMGMVLDGHTGIEHTMPPANLYNDVVQFWSATKVGYTPTFLVSYGGISGENYFYQNEPPVWKDEKLLRFTPRQNLMARARRLNIAAADDDWNHMLVAASAKKLLEAGVLVNLGQHGQRQGLGCHWDMWALSHGGSSNHDVLRFGTIFPATYIGLGDELGSIEVGKIADLAILGSNPLDDIQNTNSVRYVIKNGELFNADSMDQQWPVEEELTPFLWQQ
jgi:imidazolonepropionase-like amidohydrolase/Tol biopolymer transport system component